MDSPDDVTVVIPTRNRALLLLDAIASVRGSPLGPSARIVVVNDGSTDATSELVAAAGVHEVLTDCRSASAARNIGLEAVTTEFVAFLDDDDVWLADNPVPQLRALAADPGAVMAFGHSIMASPTLEERWARLPFGTMADPLWFLWTHPVQLGAVLFRTEAVRAAGGFDTSLPMWEDTDLYLRLANRGTIVQVEFPASLFRIRDWDRRDVELRRDHLRYRAITRRKLRGQGLRFEGLREARQSLHVRGKVFAWLCDDSLELQRRAERSLARRAALLAVRSSPIHAVYHPRRTIKAFALGGAR